MGIHRNVTDYSKHSHQTTGAATNFGHIRDHKWSRSSDRYPVRRFGGKIRECSCLSSKLILRKVLRHSPSRMPLPFELRKSQNKIVGWCSGLPQSSEHCAPPTKNNMRVVMQVGSRCHLWMKSGGRDPLRFSGISLKFSGFTKIRKLFKKKPRKSSILN